MYKAYFDASYQWDSKTAKIAFVIYDNKGNVVGKAVRNVCTVDSNYAEWLALDSLLQSLRRMKVEEVVIFGDSRNIIDIINGIARKRSYREQYQSIWKYAEKFKQITFNWVSRKENREADKLSKMQNVIEMFKAKKRRKSKTNKTKINKAKSNTYAIKPNAFDFNFTYKETAKKVMVR